MHKKPRQDEIAIFTIGLGVNVDDDLLEQVAERTGGAYFAVTSGEELNAAFDEIANRMILRLSSKRPSTSSDEPDAHERRIANACIHNIHP